MKTLFSILTASAAGLFLVGAAKAADLPSKKAAPAQYVKICDAFGAGYFYVPGSDTCLKVGGEVRAEYTVRPTNANTRTKNETSFRARAYMNLDARTKTSYGDLITFINYRITQDTGSSSVFALQQAYIKFAGITAGRDFSTFDFYYPSNPEIIGSGFASYQPITKLAYTMSLGNGISATISAEDSTDRNVGGQAAGTAGANNNTPSSGVNITYGGERAPEVVGAVKIDQAWGSSQVAGAYHEVMAIDGVKANGYAFMGGVKINLPMLAAKDAFWLQGTVAKGATGYTNPVNYGAGISSVYDSVGEKKIPTAEAVETSGVIKLAKTWSVVGALQHYWSAEFNSAVFASYLDYKGPAGTAADNAKAWLVGANTVWTPVAGFKMGPEVVYTRVKLPAGNYDDYRARLTIRRSF